MADTHDEDKAPESVSEETDHNTEDPRPDDFVIREGFPALYKPGKNRRFWLDGADPLPVQPFISYEDALTRDFDWQSLLLDCERIFTARTKDEGEAYSAGETYFIPCQMTPRCALEELALQVFRHHTKSLPPGSYDPNQSGAEWWTLVLETPLPPNSDEFDKDEDDEGDDVGMHFDADYGLESQVPDTMVHPRLATITYLSDIGVPTLILDQKSPKIQSLERTVERGWLSAPRRGKHVAFDGRLLHGAPGYIFPGYGYKEDSNEHLNKKVKLDPAATNHEIKSQGKRYTFLVNIWLNHCPLDAEPLDEQVCKQMQTSRKDGCVPYWNSSVDSSSVDSFTLSPCQPTKGEEPVGVEETTIGQSVVTFLFNMASADCRRIAQQICQKNPSSVELLFQKDAMTITVGKAPSDDENHSNADDSGSESD